MQRVSLGQCLYVNFIVNRLNEWSDSNDHSVEYWMEYIAWPDIAERRILKKQ